MSNEAEDTILAQQVGQRLTEIDSKLMTLLGLELLELMPGRAICRMLIRDDMVNSHGFCQGGLIFALADHAFAYACMSTNNAGVTLSANIIFHKPAHLGERLTATASVNNDGGRTAAAAVAVHNQAGVLVAQLQGVNYRVNRPVLEPDPE